MLTINQNVPDLEFQAYHDDQIKSMKFSDFKDKWLVVVFYPADFTFVCPTELGELADLHEEFKKEGAEVLSFSTDTAFVHKAWHDASPTIQKVTYAMAADPTGAVAREFGTYIEGVGLALRGSFIIDPEGVVKCAEMHDLPIGRSMPELLRKLKAAKFVREHGGEVCPASWEPGKDTLKPGLDKVGKI